MNIYSIYVKRQCAYFTMTQMVNENNVKYGNKYAKYDAHVKTNFSGSEKHNK